MGKREEVGEGLTRRLTIGHLDLFKIVGWVGGCRDVDGFNGVG